MTGGGKPEAEQVVGHRHCHCVKTTTMLTGLLAISSMSVVDAVVTGLAACSIGDFSA